jgi:hypothetical protein
LESPSWDEVHTDPTQLQEAVTNAHETSTAFSDEVVKEHSTFELTKQAEMKDLLQTYADGQVEMFQQAMDDWDRVSRVWCGRVESGSADSRDTVDHPPAATHTRGRMIHNVWAGAVG